MYDPVSGTICLDDQDIKAVTMESLRKKIGVVPQDTALFNDTIEYNIRYGRPTATEEEVKEAARMAHIHSAIEHLPDRYATRVGERGLMLSGGEKQRVALSRAILKNPPIMFFDEATSALDTHTEQALLVSIRDILRKERRTSVFIAHRLRTIRDADHIIVLKDGRVEEEGSHEVLMARSDGGVYRRMWHAQEEGALDGLLKDKDVEELTKE
jgi:ATP-binding cassette subfamily B (MDR/TAP) protein 7